MSFLKTTLILALLALTVSGCGNESPLNDLFQKKVLNEDFDSNRFEAKCELNVDEFTQIMEERIDDTINCLGENLRLFMSVVESGKPGYLSLKSLEAYIKNNRPDIQPEVLNVLKAVFEIKYIIFGGDREYISRENVEKIIKFALIFNEQAAKNFMPIFNAEGRSTYNLHRQQRDFQIGPSARIITSALNNIFNRNRQGEIHSLNLSDMFDRFKTEGNKEQIDNFKKLLFFKKVLIGGDSEVITHLEVLRIIRNFDSFVLLALDAVRFEKIELNQESTIKFLKEDIELLDDLIYQNDLGTRSQEIFFNLDQAISTFKLFQNKDSSFDVDKFREIITEGKLILMGGDSHVVTGSDFRRFINHTKNILNRGYYFHLFWDLKRVILESPRPVTYRFDDLKLSFPGQKELVEDFARIVSKYRFMKGEFESAYYSNDYRRNANAVFEIAAIEYILKLVFQKYGSDSSALGGKSMSKDQVAALIKKFRSALIKMDLIYPGREVKTAETVTLLGSLFEFQSDDNKLFDINEATEFFVSVFTSLNVSDAIYKVLKSKGCKVDTYGRLEPSCVRKYFFEGVCLNYPNNYPKLFESLGATVFEPVDPSRPNGPKNLVCKIPQIRANLDYLDATIKTARTCTFYPDSNFTEEIWYSKGDLLSIFLAMMHIETTILRWDTINPNNIMDPDEVMNAYAIYSPALDGFLEDAPAVIRKLKKQIYQYLIKYEKVPDQKDFGSLMKFAGFLLSFKKSAPANRKTIAAILAAIGSAGEPEKFDCNLLRRPDQIPDSYDPSSTPVALKRTNLSLTESDLALKSSLDFINDAALEDSLRSLSPEIFNN
jgi:Holliday junction resolvase